MKIEQVKFILWAKDMDRAVAFWRDAFGFEPKLVTPYWSELAFGDAILALHGGGDGEFRETGLAIQVEDLAAACAEVKEGGGIVRSEPEDRPNEGIRLADLEDPEGNGFQMSQRLG